MISLVIAKVIEVDVRRVLRDDDCGGMVACLCVSHRNICVEDKQMIMDNQD